MTHTKIEGTAKSLDDTEFAEGGPDNGTAEYLVFDTLAEAEATREMMGRRLAREQWGGVWPIVGTRVGGGKFKDGAGLTYWHEDFRKLKDGKYAILRDADIDRWRLEGVEETTDGTKPLG